LNWALLNQINEKKKRRMSSSVGILKRRDQVQLWRRIPFIESSYRLDYSFTSALLSVFCWHNETLNIWTHLFGWGLALWWMIRSLETWLKDGDATDKMFFTCIMLASQAQMLFSVSHHWFGCMTQTIYYITARLDYSAIAILLPMCTASVIYYILYCSPLYFWIYSLLNIVFGFCVLCLCWWPTFQTPPYQKFRAFMFSSLGLFVVSSWLHGFYLYPELWVSDSFFWQKLVGVIMGSGVAVYISRYPERLQPGVFLFLHLNENLYDDCYLLFFCLNLCFVWLVGDNMLVRNIGLICWFEILV
jgi:adiponectin receptor